MKLSEKLNLAQDHTVLLLPLKGVSAVDAEGNVFWGEQEDKVLFDTLRRNVDSSRIPVVELDLHINDREFGETAARLLMKLIDLQKK